jgi:HEAT repeat protein
VAGAARTLLGGFACALLLAGALAAILGRRAPEQSALPAASSRPRASPRPRLRPPSPPPRAEPPHAPPRAAPRPGPLATDLARLAGALADGEDEAVAAAVGALAARAAHDGAALADLVRLLEDREADPLLRAGAAVALGRLADPAAIAALLGALGSDTDPTVRRHAALALGEPRGDEDPGDGRTVRARTGEGFEIEIGLVAEPEAREALRAVIRGGEDPELVRAAMSALARADPEDETGRAIATVLVNRSGGDAEAFYRAEAASALGDAPLGPEARAALLDALANDPDPGVRAAAAHALGPYAGEAPGAALEAALANPAEAIEVREGAALGLAESEDPRAIAAALAAAAAPEADLRRLGMLALGRRPLPDACLAALAAGLADADPGVRVAAAVGLAAPRDAAVRALAAALVGDPDPSVRVAAAYSLLPGETLDPRAVLARAAADDPVEDVRAAAAAEIEALGGPP